MSRQFAALLALIFWLAAGVALAEAVVARLAGEVQVRDKGGDVVLTVPVTEAVPWKVWLADDPPRLIVEFNDLDWDGAPDVKSSSIAEVRIERAGPDWLRLVAYLREPLTVIRAEMAADDGGAAVLQLLLAPTTGAAFTKQAGTLDELVIEPTPTRPVIVIDPGHGGRDPGALSGEVNEAALMLSFALLLKDVLDETGQFDVVLTRDADEFVPLEVRLSRARAAKADVFLSLHADRLADGSGEASGLTLYSLGRSFGADAGERTVARHRPDDILKDVDLGDTDDAVALALMALQRQDTDPRTAALSARLLSAFRVSGLQVNSRPERQGDFAVLKAADIPSVLVELGFLSSEADLERLTSDNWRQAASAALRDGLMQWVQEDQVMQQGRRK